MGRLSPHPAMLEDSAGSGRRVVPTSVAPITFFVAMKRNGWRCPASRSAHQEARKEIRGLGAGARDVLAFLAFAPALSFFADIVRGSDKLKSDGGRRPCGNWWRPALVTADGFDNLRALIDPKRRSGHGSGKTNRPRHTAGTMVSAVSVARRRQTAALWNQYAVCWSVTARIFPPSSCAENHAYRAGANLLIPQRGCCLRLATDTAETIVRAVPWTVGFFRCRDRSAVWDRSGHAGCQSHRR